MLEDAMPFLDDYRRKHAIAFYAAALLLLVVAIEGALAIFSYALPQEFCIAGTLGNCAGLQMEDSARFWEAARPISLSNVSVWEGGGNATLRNEGAEALKLVGLALHGVDGGKAAYSFAGAKILQPGGQIELELGAEKGCGEGIARYDVVVEYANFQGTHNETGRRLFVKCSNAAKEA